MPKPRKQDTRGPLQRMHDNQRLDEEQSALNVLTPEQRAKGTYEGGQRILNRGGTPVARWLATGKLSDTQHIAIQHCLRLWDMVGINQRTTASYGERVPASFTMDERRTLNLIEAREDLYRIMNYTPRPYWDVFENVCRHDEPAGIAGSRLGFGSRSAQDRAHTIVCFVADLIAMREGMLPTVRILVA